MRSSGTLVDIGNFYLQVYINNQLGLKVVSIQLLPSSGLPVKESSRLLVGRSWCRKRQRGIAESKNSCWWGGADLLVLQGRNSRCCPECHLPDCARESLNKQPDILEIGFIFFSPCVINYHLLFPCEHTIDLSNFF